LSALASLFVALKGWDSVDTETTSSLQCPSCNQKWTPKFDNVSVFLKRLLSLCLQLTRSISLEVFPSSLPVKVYHVGEWRSSLYSLLSVDINLDFNFNTERVLQSP